MEKYGKISGLTMYYESNANLLHKGLMLRYVNDDVSFDIEQKIDFELKVLKDNPDRTPNSENSYADFTYWKYKFLSNEKNKYYDIKKALSYLDEAFKKGNPDAIAQYGYYYYTGTVITNIADKKKGIKLFKKAMDIASNRRIRNQETPFMEYLIAEALFSDCSNEDKRTLKTISNLYETALKEKKVLFCKKNLARTYIKLEQNLERAEALLLEDYDFNECPKLMREIRDIRNKQTRK